MVRIQLSHCHGPGSFLGQGSLSSWTSLVAQMVKHLPTVRETQVRSLCWEDPLEKEMATHSSILACRIPWTEEPGGLQSMGSKESDMTEQLTVMDIQKQLAQNQSLSFINISVWYTIHEVISIML